MSGYSPDQRDVPDPSRNWPEPDSTLDTLAVTLRDRLTYAAGSAIDALAVDDQDAHAWMLLDAAWYHFTRFVAETAELHRLAPRRWTMTEFDWLRAQAPTCRIIRKLGTANRRIAARPRPGPVSRARWAEASSAGVRWPRTAHAARASRRCARTRLWRTTPERRQNSNGRLQAERQPQASHRGIRELTATSAPGDAGRYHGRPRCRGYPVCLAIVRRRAPENSESQFADTTDVNARVEQDRQQHTGEVKF